MRSIRRLPLIVVTLAGGLAACSASPQGEDTASSGAAITSSYEISATQYAGLASLLDASGTTVADENGTLVLTPSARTTSYLWPGTTPASHAVSTPLPTFPINPPSPLGTYTVTVTAFQMTSFETDLATSDVHAHANFTGNIHLHSGNVLQPDFDVALSGVGVDVLIGVRGSASSGVAASSANGGLVLDGLTVTAQTQVTNCWDGLCDGFIQGQMPNVGAALQQQIQGPLQQALAASAPYTGLLQALSTYEGYVNPSAAGELVAGSPTISGGAIEFDLAKTPVQPASCTYELECGGIDEPMVVFSCAANGDPLELQLDSSGSWVDVGPVFGQSAMSYFAETSEQASFRVCAYNAAGTVCSGTIAVSTPQQAWCSTSAGGSGGSSSGGVCGGHKVCPK